MHVGDPEAGHNVGEATRFDSGFYMGEELVLRSTAPAKALEGAQPTKDKPHRARGPTGKEHQAFMDTSRAGQA
jgi:hypothetical protein